METPPTGTTRVATDTTAPSRTTLNANTTKHDADAGEPDSSSTLSKSGTCSSLAAADKIHRCDQRQPEIHFWHSGTETAVVLHQHGAGTKQFVGDTSSVLWPVARHLCNYLCDRVKILRQEQCEEQLNVNGDEGGSCHADRLVDGVKIPALRKMVAGSSSEEDHVKLKQERDQKVRCIELGTGTGLVGIVLAHLGAEVVLTDQTLDLARENIELQPEKARARLNARELVWGETALDPVRDRHGYDLVVASDVICHQGKEVMQVLVATISSLLSRSSEARALVAYEFRDDWWTCSTFCDLCAAQGLQLTSLSLEPDDEDSDFILYVLRHDTSDAKQGAE